MRAEIPEVTTALSSMCPCQSWFYVLLEAFDFMGHNELSNSCLAFNPHCFTNNTSTDVFTECNRSGEFRTKRKKQSP